MREYATPSRKSTATPAGLRPVLARIIAEGIIDAVSEEQISANLKFAGATEAELDATTRSHIRKALLAIHRRCFWCDREFSDKLPATLDHETPKSRGGSDDIENLKLCCEKCNSSKRAKIASQRPIPFSKTIKREVARLRRSGIRPTPENILNAMRKMKIPIGIGWTTEYIRRVKEG